MEKSIGDKIIGETTKDIKLQDDMQIRKVASFSFDHNEDSKVTTITVIAICDGLAKKIKIITRFDPDNNLFRDAIEVGMKESELDELFQKDEMPELLRILNYIDEYGESIYYPDDNDVYVKESQITTYSKYIASRVLIDDCGHCNWDNIKIVRESGHRVFAGERDSFGWLTGCIKTKKGIIVYG